MRAAGAPAGVMVGTKLGPNDPCWCGSGRKFKRCHRTSSEALVPGRVSPMRAVPAGIPRPPYLTEGEERKDEPMVKSADVINRMRRAGRAAAEVLAEVGAAVAPGVTTDHLDALAHEACIARGGYPSPLGFLGYPKSLCTSVNEVICHGIPDDRPLADGDIVNLDVTIYLDGVHGDLNATYLVGTVDRASQALVDCTRACLEAGIAAVRPGVPLSVVGGAIEPLAADQGYGVVRAFGGHGIGTTFHGAPAVPHHIDRSAATILEPGMTFTVEPMITMGSYRAVVWPDGWTAVTADGRRSAQFEHTILVTEDGAEILTR